MGNRSAQMRLRRHRAVMAFNQSLTPKLVAEALGALALCYVGILAINQGAGLVGVALAHGLILAVMVSALMLISGAHFNPAVTLGLLIGGKIKPVDAGFYVGAQLIGATAGALLASLSLPDVTDAVANGTPALGGGVAIGTAILVEAILTFFLVLVVYGTGVHEGFGARVAGLAIGLTVAADILAGGPITGAAMNPSRWFGPALVSGTWDDALVYLLGPALGGVLAGLLYTRVLAKSN